MPDTRRCDPENGADASLDRGVRQWQDRGVRRLASVRPWVLILALHVALAGFVTLRGYPITQDGPAHLYGTHIIHSLGTDPRSPFRGFFESNLKPIGNSLFFYLAVWGEGVLSPERITGLALFVALLALPLSALAFARALGGESAADSTPIDPAAAVIVACPLAYNYFLYRGFFNFCWSVPLAVGCLAAVVAAGRRTAGPGRVAGLAVGAAVLASLAALAHPAALVFLLCAVPAACLAGSRSRRGVGLAVMIILAAIGWSSRIASNAPSPTVFCTPWSSVVRAVRVLGVTHGWPEAIVALTLLALLALGARRALSPLRTVPARWATAWPAACAVVMMVAFFFVPFEFGGAAGQNERLPLFAAMLLSPYAALPSRRHGAAIAAFALFGLYTGFQSVRLERLAAEIREADAVESLAQGSLAYPVVLDLRLGSLAADLGRHVLADVARRRDLVMPDVFCGHPAHPLRCSPRLPVRVGEDEVERAHRPLQLDRGPAVSDDDLRRMFERVREQAARADYLLVVSSDDLLAAFEANVATPLGASRISPAHSRLGVYAMPGFRGSRAR
jgi:hypothetical protein